MTHRLRKQVVEGTKRLLMVAVHRVVSVQNGIAARSGTCYTPGRNIPETSHSALATCALWNRYDTIPQSQWPRYADQACVNSDLPDSILYMPLHPRFCIPGEL
jgi:hypothetical protein